MKIKFIAALIAALIIGSTVSAQNKNSAKTWAVVIGISRYKNIVSLNYADRDAQAFYNYLTRPDGGPRLTHSQVKLLLNENAQSTEIYQALDWLHANVLKNDRVIFYFSGHADVENKTKDQNGFLLAYNSPSTAYETTGTISIKYLEAYLKSYVTSNKAANVMLIADACRSGKLAGGNEGAKLTRIALTQNPDKKIIRILSAQQDEISLESNQWGRGRGVFSYYLLKGIEGLANRNNDSLITTAELAAYLPLAVANATGNIQNPLIEGNPNEVLFLCNPNLHYAQKNDDSITVQNSLYGDDWVYHLSNPDKAYYKKYLGYLHKGWLIWGHDENDTTHCAKFYYLKLMGEPDKKSIKESIKASFIAALQHKTQVILDSFISFGAIGYNTLEAYKEICYVKQLVNPDYILYNYIVARAYFLSNWYNHLQGNPAQAFKKALQYEPDAPYTLNELGFVYAGLGQADSAIFYYQKAIEVAPGWAFPYNNLGEVYVSIKKYDQAIASYKTAIRLNPLHPFAYYNLGLAYTDINEFSTSIDMYNKAIALDSCNDDFYSLLGMSYIYMKDYVPGLSNLKKAVLLNPGNYQSNYNLACGYSAINDTEKGVFYIKKTLDLGYRNYNQYMQDEDLINLRQTKAFKDLMKEYFPKN